MNRRYSTTMFEVVLLALLLVACGTVPIPNTPTAILVATETQLPPTSTLQPTSTPEPTLTPEPTATPIPGDFEISDEGWGDYPTNEFVHPGENVKIYNDNSLPIKHTGNSSLKYQPVNVVDGNAYVARFANPDDVKSKISIFVYVPSSELCLGNKCSTARIIIWDNKYKSYESDPVTLNQVGKWVELTLDLSGTNYPQPYQAIGVHFYLSTQYKGPFYIDTVTITHSQ